MLLLCEDAVRVKKCGATYQQCLQSYFKEQIGHNLEVYVDDIIVKTRRGDSLINDLEKTFTNLRCFNIRLNPEKCTFEVPRGKLLGYIITRCDIEANPDKISAIVEIGQVRNVNDVQWPGQECQGCPTAHGVPPCS
jgi:hypothetical protein